MSWEHYLGTKVRETLNPQRDEALNQVKFGAAQVCLGFAVLACVLTNVAAGSDGPRVSVRTYEGWDMLPQG